MQIAVEETAPARTEPHTLSYNQLVLRRFVRHRLAIIGLVAFIMIALAALSG